MRKVLYAVAGVVLAALFAGSAFAAPIIRPTITGDLIGKYRARIYVYDTHMPIFLDLSSRKADYERGNVYENGSIVHYVEVWRSDFRPLSGGDGSGRMESALDLYVLKGTDYVGTLNCVLEYKPGLDAWKIVETSFHPAPDVGIFTREGPSPQNTGEARQWIMYR